MASISAARNALAGKRATEKAATQSRTQKGTFSRVEKHTAPAPPSPPLVHTSKKPNLSPAPEPTTISPSGLFENEVSTYFLEQSLRNENEQLRLRLQSLEQQYTQLQTQHTQARQATAPTTASPSTTATPTPQPAAQQTGPQLVWTHTKSFFTASDSHIRVYYKSLSHIMQSMA